MAISLINSGTATNPNASSVTVTKPAGTANGDLLLAFFTSNNQNATAPSGFVEIVDGSIEVFRVQAFYKVAGASEPANYVFSVTANAPLAVSMSAFRGIDTSDPIDINPSVGTSLTHSEPYTTPTISGGLSGRVVYFRSVRYANTTIPTFTASGATEVTDVGVFSGGSVCYAQALYIATSDYSAGGSKSGLAITCSQTESHNVVSTLAIRAANNPALLGVTIPSIPSMSASGTVGVPATMDATIPALGPVSIGGFYGNPEGVFDVQILPSMDVAAEEGTGGLLDAVVLPVLTFVGETARVAENVVLVDSDERWTVVTQDGYREGTRRATRSFSIFMQLPRIGASFAGTVSALGQTVFGDTVAENPMITTTSCADVAADAVVEAYGAIALTGAAGAPGEEVSPTVVTYDATAAMSFPVGDASASVVVFTTSQTEAYADCADVLVQSFDAGPQHGTFAYAGHAAATTLDPAPVVEAASATVTAYAVTVFFDTNRLAQAGSVAVSVQADNVPPTQRLAEAGHASVICHN